MCSKILVIDDNQAILTFIELLLGSKYNVITAAGGREGLQKAFVEKPHLILLDRQMPDMDGNETLVQLGTSPQTKNIPVIMLTGDHSPSDIETSFDLGAQDYIVKPFDDIMLMIRIEQILKKTRFENET